MALLRAFMRIFNFLVVAFYFTSSLNIHTLCKVMKLFKTQQNVRTKGNFSTYFLLIDLQRTHKVDSKVIKCLKISCI